MKDFLRINYTSGSMNKLDERKVKLDFSPMYLGPVNTNPKALIFENWWQYGKKFKDMGHTDKSKWLKFQ